MMKTSDAPDDTIKRLLKKRGLSQQRFAYETGISRSTLNRIALGWYVPDEETKSLIADCLGMSVEEIWSK